MAMSTGAKVAIGCGIAIVVAGGIAVVGLGVGAMWLKGKVEKSGSNLSALAHDIDQHRRRANANRFAPPADGVIDESRLRKFLEVRKQVYAVYEQHKPEFEAVDARTKGKAEPGLGDIVDMGVAMGRLVADIQLAQYKGLAEVGMNEEEYRYLQTAVYKTAWGVQVEPPSEQDLKKGDATIDDASARTRGLDVPQANLELFRKYEADIKKYAMHGLAMVGL
jgi:hypothetical protein